MSGRRKFGGAWETWRLGALATFRKGRGIRRTDLRTIGARCVRYGELYTRYRNYVVDPVSRIPEDVAATALRIEKGELLFAGSGETAEEIGTCVAYIGDEPAYAGGDIIVLRVPRQDPVYLAHLMNAPEAVRQKARMAQGDAVVHIRGDHLAEVQVPLPPLAEQRAIAAVLIDVDALIGSLEALIAKKRAIKRAAIQQLLTGRTRLPGFRGEWARVAVGRIAETYGGLAGKTKADFGTGAARYISFLDVLENVRITRRKFDRVRIARSESQHRVRVGDVLFNATSETPEDLAMGAVVAVDADDLYLNSFCFGLRIRERGRCDPSFLAYLSRGGPGRTATYALAQGATRYNLSKRRFLALELLLPPFVEQRAIAAVLADMNAEIETLERRLDKTQAIKQGMMQQLLTGAVRLPIPDGLEGESHDA